MGKIDLTGQRFGKLVVFYEIEERRDRRVCWVCKCSCGNIKVMSGKLLRNGHARSCGCMERKTHGKYKTSEYQAWRDMKDRCYNPNNKRYRDYGGRGIKVCEKWLNSFTNFYNDMGGKPSEDYSIDRIDNEGNYGPNNCKWSTRLEQLSNIRAKGYSYCKIKDKWKAQIQRNKVHYMLGYFDTPEKARQAYLEAKEKLDKI